MARKRVLFLKERAEGTDPYEECFSKSGFDVAFACALEFEFFNADKLTQCIGTPHQFAGVVCTSPRAAQAFHCAYAECKASEDVCQQWKSMPFHSVGPATAKTLAACGFQPSVFEDAQSSLLLGKRLAELYKSATKELLVLVGDRRRDEMLEHFVACGTRHVELEVYRTVLNARLGDAIAALLPGGSPPHCVAFFSPSGIEAAQKHAADALKWSALHKAAIGPTTATALNASGWKASAVASKPTPTDLLRAVSACLAEGSGTDTTVAGEHKSDSSASVAISAAGAATPSATEERKAAKT